MIKKLFSVIDGRIALVIFSILLGLLSIYGREISPHDEERFAGIAREMIIKGDYLQPRLNGVPFNEYPFLGYLPSMGGMRLFGVCSPFVVHLCGVLLGTATVWLTFLMGRQLGGRRIGLLSGFILQTTSGFIIISRSATVDPALLSAVTLSLYGFLAACMRPCRAAPYRILFFTAMAAGFLVKGLIGAGIPLAVALAYLVMRRDTRHISRFFLNRTALCFVLPVLFWIGALARSGSENSIGQVLQQSLFRFVSPSADHHHPPYFYCITIVGHLLPWSLLPIFLLWMRFGPAKRKLCELDRNAIFPAVWCATVFFALSLSSAKRPIYLGPIYPPWAIIAAMLWERLRQRIRVPPVLETRLPALGLTVFAVCLIFVARADTPENSHRFIFRKAESVGAPIYLYHPNEAIRGGAVFYLGRTVPVLQSEQDLLALLDDPGAKAVLALVRNAPSDMLTILEHAERVQTLLKHQGGGGKEYRLYSIVSKEATRS